jgi:hypothetical protein
VLKPVKIDVLVDMIRRAAGNSRGDEEQG